MKNYTQTHTQKDIPLRNLSKAKFNKIEPVENGNSQSLNNLEETSFIHEQVVKGGDPLIEIRFDTLINVKCDRPSEWYQDETLQLDKSYASKIRRGIIIPPNWLKIKIAHYFNVDSLTIWKEKNKSQRYSKCSKCSHHSYLTAGKYFLCTFCENKDYPKSGEIKKLVLENQGGLI